MSVLTAQPTSRVSRAEIAVAAALLMALAAVAYGWHVADGGFYYDDWANAANTHHPIGGGGFGAVIDYYADFTAYRPTLILYIPLTHWIFGDHASLHLAWAAVLTATMSASFYWVLRLLAVERLHAGVMAALVTLFPFADATRLWSTASVTALAIALWLAGLGVAVLAFRAEGRRATLLHGGSLALYLLSLWTYEITAAAVGVSGLLYFTQVPWRRALRRWAVDGAALVASLLILTTSTQNEALGVADLDNHARLIAREGAQIIALALVPFGTPARWLICGLIAAVGALAAGVWLTLGRADPLRRPLLRWLGVGVAGVVVAAAGWVVFVPAHWYYTPTPLGLANRVNVLATLGLVMLAYATLMVLGLLVSRALPRLGRAWLVVPLAGAIAIGAGYADRLLDDERTWNRASDAENRVLDALSAALPAPRPHSTVLTFGAPGWQGPGVPIFASSWDLNGAVKMLWDDWRIDGFPVVQGTSVSCGSKGIVLVGGGYPPQPRPYGSVYLVDVVARRVARPRSLAQCNAAVPRFRPGPLLPTPSA